MLEKFVEKLAHCLVVNLQFDARILFIEFQNRLDHHEGERMRHADFQTSAFHVAQVIHSADTVFGLIESLLSEREKLLTCFGD